MIDQRQIMLMYYQCSVIIFIHNFIENAFTSFLVILTEYQFLFTLPTDCSGR